MLSGKRILLGVSGSIAAYKALDLLRRLKEQGADVRVVMTRNGTRFVAPLTFEVLSGSPVLVDEFSDKGWGAAGHIGITRDLDLVLVAPATADIIGKAAAGIGDDALTTSLLAASCPVIMAPAMNERMYRNPLLKKNMDILRSAGVRFVPPGSGPLACGESGEGRLADIEKIIKSVFDVLQTTRLLRGITLLVTAGPTREPIDAIRYITNPSTGKMGYAVAEAARDAGANVILISGPTYLAPPANIDTIFVTTAEDMRQAVMEKVAQADVVVMAAAVSDFRPINPSPAKIKKENADTTIILEQTEDILMSLGKAKGGRILVGFAAETDDLIQNAKKKMEKKNLDLIVANDVGKAGAGFAADTNAASLITSDGKVLTLPSMTKRELAKHIIQKIAEIKTNQGL